MLYTDKETANVYIGFCVAGSELRDSLRCWKFNQEYITVLH